VVSGGLVPGQWRARNGQSFAKYAPQLMEQAARIARFAADRVEEQIDSATLPQAVVTFGVMTDKVLALSGDPAMIIQHEHAHVVEHHIKPMTIEDYLREIEEREKREGRGVEVPELPSSGSEMHLLTDSAPDKKN
jgi:hypothetical protein